LASCFISLAGAYMTYMPRPKTLTISRRLKYLTEKEQKSANKRTRSVNSVREIIQCMYKLTRIITLIKKKINRSAGNKSKTK
jgi:Ribonuclease G/E